MNNALMHAIFSMDAYNRGYDAGIEIYPENETDNKFIGTAKIIKNSSVVFNDADKDISFYALAYSYDGQTTIAYRGTDDALSDAIHGWPLGGGFEGAQGQMAIDFYNEVVNATSTSITTTGHSLGGGLAGLVAAISGQPSAVRALIYDSMDYEDAASELVSDYSNIFIGAYHIEGEVLSGMTPFSPSDPSALVDVDIGDKSNLGPVDLHSQATLVLGLYAKTEIGAQTDWKAASLYMWDVLYDDTFATSIGVNLSGTSSPSDILRTIIAYSAIDEGTRVFGDTGIRALYDDANNLGVALSGATASQALTTYATDISKVFVHFAGQLALNEVRQTNVPTAVDGILTITDQVDDKTLSINLSDDYWGLTTVSPLHNADVSRDSLLTALLIPTGIETQIHTAMDVLWGDDTANAIDRVVFALNDAGTTIVSEPLVTTTKATLFVGGAGGSIVTGFTGNNLLLGGAGVDKLNGNIGSDIIFGGIGDDLLLFGGDGDDFLYGGIGVDIVDGGLGVDTFAYSRGDGDDIWRDGDWSQGSSFRFGATISAGDLNYIEDGNDLLITVEPTVLGGLDGGTIRLQGYTSAGASPNNANIIFEDGGAGGEGGLFFGGDTGVNLTGDKDGEARSDFLFGGDGNDNIFGFDFGDVLRGGGGNDLLDGGNGNDLLDGGDGNDRLVGGSGNDTLNGGAGQDILSGGDGDDILEDFSGGNTLRGDAGDDILRGTGGLDGGAGNDRLEAGGVLGVNMSGGDGDDILIDSVGNDGLSDGDGQDQLTIGAGNDTIVNAEDDFSEVFDAGEGDDVFVVNLFSNDSFIGGAGDDGADVPDTRYFLTQEDFDRARTTNLYFDMGDGNDSIQNTSLGDDIIHLGDGDDSIIVGTPRLRVDGVTQSPFVSHDQIFSGMGNDVIFNFSQTATIEDTGGNDLYYHVFGGTGFTTSTDKKTIIKDSGDIGNNDMLAIRADEIVLLSNMSFTQTGVDDLTISFAGQSHSVVVENYFAVDGASKVEFLQLSTNFFEFTGNFLTQAIATNFPNYFSGRTLDEANQFNRINIDTLLNNSNFGAEIADSIIGTGAGDVIFSLGGDDFVDGGAGSDYIEGGDGNDELRGNEGNDGLIGGAGNDILIGGLGNDGLIGGDGDDILDSGPGTNILYGGAGNDTYFLAGTGERETTVFDEEGNDTYVYSRGSLILHDNNGNDTFLFDPTYTTDDFSVFEIEPGGPRVLGVSTVDGAQYFGFNAAFLGFESLDFVLDANDTPNWLQGSDDNDSLQGDQVSDGYNDVIFGKSGNDLLIGNGGDDILFGGFGDDIYAFNSGDGDDIIVDEGGVDVLQIGDGLTLSSLSFSQVGLDLVIEIASGVTIVGQFSGDPARVVEFVSFDDGTMAELPNPFMQTNQPPIAVGDEFTGDEDVIVMGNVLGNDGDPDGDVLSVEPLMITTAEGGTVELLASGDFTYTPLENFNGSDSFDYTLLDPSGESDTATVMITINSINDDPIAQDDSFNTDEDMVLNGNLLADNGNGVDSDIDGDTLTIQTANITTAAGATVILNNDGSFDYTPLVNFNGADSFDYTLEDGQGGMDAGTVNINVLPVNDAPEAMDDSFSGIIDAQITGNVLSDNGNGADSDVDGDPLSVEPDVISTANGGTVTLLSNGDFTYEPAMLFTGQDSFNYTLKDGQNGMDTATVLLSIETPDDDAITGTEGRDTLYGTNDNDIMEGLGGNDWMFGRKGDDIMSSGDGRDVLYGDGGDDMLFGNDGNDLLFGGSGNDMLYGGAGRNLMSGGGGADTFVFESDNAFDAKDTITGFNQRQGDAIDISDLLSEYDPLDDAIGDFVQISGGRFGKTLSIDIDGGGDNFVDIAKIFGSISTNEESLVNNGTLIIV